MDLRIAVEYDNDPYKRKIDLASAAAAEKGIRP
jgi:hypothetical protein